MQYSFPSKDDLVRALIERWTRQFDALFGDTDGVAPTGLLRKYTKVMRGSQAALNAKMAGLMIAYLQNPQNGAKIRQWHRSMVERLGGPCRAAPA